jgi:hypothetical protein
MAGKVFQRSLNIYLVVLLLAAASMQSPQAQTCTPPPSPNSSYSVDPENLTAGSYAANSLSPDFTNPAGQIFSQSYWTTSAKKYMAANNFANFSVRGNYCSRDMEATTWTRNGYIFLRLTPEGKAIYAALNGEASGNAVEIGIATGCTDGSYDPPRTYPLW